jgi:serine/threonine protein kinase
MPQGSPPRDNGQATLSRGATIGRYVVLGLVGRGGMGEVYAAYDPELDRKVAVKLLRVKPGNGVSLVEGRQRTLREAQAIARLSHPNVVVVYDVGTYRDQVFIAMEFVEGNTVTYWAQAQARSWQEVLKVFTAAGRGLAVAHDKGLVHRDFKPDNVMVGGAGQVRVMDFGLARQLNEKEPQSPRRSTDPQATVRPDAVPIVDAGDQATMVLNTVAGEASGPVATPEHADMFEASLTRTGAMMGTPAYMAPEQFLGVGSDARTDQFSFCVALYEALYGQRPFGGNTLYALTNNVVQGKVREAPAQARVPAWLRRVVLRGLRSNPAERYPTMAELIEALGKNPAVQRRRVILGVAAVAAIAALGVGVRRSAAENQALCSGAPGRLADVWEIQPTLEGTYPRQTQIRSAFYRSGKSYAADVFATVSHSLTKYAQEWAAMYKESCEATQVRGEQSGEVLDLRMSCLSERLGGFKALTDVFGAATGDVVENAVNAANALSPLDRCADIPLLRAVVRPPDDPVMQARVGALRRRFAEVKAVFDAGRWKDAQAAIPALVSQVREIGYQPLIAETLALQGNILVKTRSFKEAQRTLTDSFLAADVSRHDEVRAEVAANLVYVVGQARSFSEAEQWARTADAVLQRLGGHELLRAWLLNDLGCVLEAQGNREEAVRSQENALALKENALGSEHPDVGTSEGNLSISFAGLGRFEEALKHARRSTRLLEAGLGSGHPDLASALSNEGEIYNALGRYADARASFERARSIWEKELGRDSPVISYALTGIGASYLGEGRPADAIAPLETALKIRRERDPDAAKLGETGFALAQALWGANQERRRAERLADEARTLFGKSADSSQVPVVEAWLHQRDVGK